MRLSRCLVISALALAPIVAHAQKKVLTQSDWDKWKSIQGAAIANDGKWALYSLVPQVGDGELVLRATQGSTEYRVPRGYLGRPNNVPGGLRPRPTGNPEDDPTGATAAPGQFTADSKYAVVLTYPAQTEFDRAARNRRQAAPEPLGPRDRQRRRRKGDHDSARALVPPVGQQRHVVGLRA